MTIFHSLSNLGTMVGLGWALPMVNSKACYFFSEISSYQLGSHGRHLLAWGRHIINADHGIRDSSRPVIAIFHSLSYLHTIIGLSWALPTVNISAGYFFSEISSYHLGSHGRHLLAWGWHIINADHGIRDSSKPIIVIFHSLSYSHTILGSGWALPTVNISAGYFFFGNLLLPSRIPWSEEL